MNFKERTCKKSGYVWKQYNSLQKCPCEICVEELKEKYSRKEFKPRQSIKKVSDKRKIEKPVYDLKRILFLRKPENKLCCIKGVNCTRIATTIEHSMGRKGYADEWARENKISLYIDERFFKPACNNCNIELENNPELSRKHQLSKISGKEKYKK